MSEKPIPCHECKELIEPGQECVEVMIGPMADMGMSPDCEILCSPKCAIKWLRKQS